MSTPAVHPLTVSVLLFAVLTLPVLTLAGCGSGHTTVCPATAPGGCCVPGGIACPIGPGYLYADGVNGQVTSFLVDDASGALGTPTSVSGGPLISLGFVSLDNQFLYASDFQNALIDGWSINQSTGALTPIAGSPFSLAPLSLGASLAANNASEVLYVADVNKIDAYKADSSTGALTTIAGSPFSSGTNLFLTTDLNDQFLFATDDDPPGGVLAFTINSSTGALTPVAGSPFAIGPAFSGSTEMGGVVVDETGSFVYATMITANQVAAFLISKPSGALTPVLGSPFPTGNNPISLIAINNFLYVSAGQIYGYSFDATTGALTPLAGSPFNISGASLATGFNVLYVTGDSGVQAFSIDSTTGNLTAIAGSPFLDTGASLLALVPQLN